MNRVPWQHPLASRLNDLPKVHLTFPEAAKQVRNRLRRFSVRSIADHAMRFLHQANARPRNVELPSWPWITLLIVKLVLEDESIPLDKGDVCTPEAFDRCRQTMWDAQGARDRAEPTPGGVYLMMRSLIQAQLPFQRNISWDFVRWPALIARLPPEHSSRRLFVERLGLEPEVFVCLCYALFVPVVNGDRALTLQAFAPLRRLFGPDVDRFIGEFARDLQGLRAELRAYRSRRADAGKEARPRHEFQEFPWLSNFPLLRLSEDRFAIWHPAVLTRGMEEGVHRRLSEAGGHYSQSFSGVFEGYVLELIDEAGIEYLGETTYKEALGADASAVEAIITADGVNVFVDAKLTVYSSDVAVSNQAPVVWKGLKQVSRAMEQAWKVGTRLREGTTPAWECTDAQEDFLVVVTSQQLSCATGSHLERMLREGQFDPDALARRGKHLPTAAHLQRLPLRNVLIASIDEFERLMCAVRDGVVQLVPFVRDVAEANQDPRTSVMFLEQMIAERMGTTRRSMPAAIEEARQRAEETFLGLIESG